MTARDRSLWILTCSRNCRGNGRRSSGEIVHAGSPSGRVLSRTRVSHPQALAVGEGGVWAADFWGSSVERLDPHSGKLVASIELSLPEPLVGTDSAFLPFDVATGEGGVWVSTARGYVAQIDPSNNRLVGMIEVAADATGAIAAGGGAVWLGQSQLGVLRIDPESGRRDLIPIEDADGRRLSADSLAVKDGSVWVSGLWAKPGVDETGHRRYTLTDEAAVAEIRTDTAAVARVVVLNRPATIAAIGAGAVWLADFDSPVVYRLGLRTRRVTGSRRVRGTNALVAVAGHKVWIATRRGDLRPLP